MPARREVPRTSSSLGPRLLRLCRSLRPPPPSESKPRQAERRAGQRPCRRRGALVRELPPEPCPSRPSGQGLAVESCSYLGLPARFRVPYARGTGELGYARGFQRLSSCAISTCAKRP